MVMVWRINDWATFVNYKKLFKAILSLFCDRFHLQYNTIQSNIVHASNAKDTTEKMLRLANYIIQTFFMQSSHHYQCT